MKRMIQIAAVVVTLTACNNATSNQAAAANAVQGADSMTTEGAHMDTVSAAEAVAADTGAKAETKGTSAAGGNAVANVEGRSLAPLYGAYFELKDALAKDNGKAAQQAAEKMETSIAKVDAAALSAPAATVWKQYQRKLAFDAEHIAGIAENEHQREHFVTLSKNMYALIKVAKPEAPVYYQHCPMYNEGKGAHWLSKQKAIDNPYLGKSMANCGSTVATIQ